MTNDNWILWAISDADEPGDAILTGMRHRGFDGVTFVTIPDEDGWLYADGSEVPVRPLLLFYRGDEPDADEVLAWLEKHSEEDFCAVPGPVPTSYDSFDEGDEAIRSVHVSLSYPPYPWLEEAKLGMEMARYFDAVELMDWIDPTDTQPGSHTFRFYRRKFATNYGTSDLESDVHDLPY